MKFDTITINGTDYRVEFNWNCMVAFLEENDLALTAIDDLSKLKPSQVTSFCFEAVKEGARLQEIELPFTLKDFGAAIGVKTVTDLLVVYRRQITANNSVGTTKKKNWLSRRK